ncbi:MAG: tetratricopeptide repeat protein [Candidatus Omnitrophica bacterium]|nr:tetratricopeptide repeat protein [Candidatus Omnitrophota bacterium]
MNRKAPLAAVIMFALIICANAEEGVNRKAAEYFKQASEYAARNDWPRAIDCLLNAKDLAPGEKEITKGLAVYYNNWAMQLGDSGDLDVAREKLEKALTYDGQNRIIKTNLANYLLRKAQLEYKNGYTDSAINTIRESLEADPENVNGYMTLGDIYYETDDFEKAALNWRQARKLDPAIEGVDTRFAKLKKEEAVEAKFRERVGPYFKIKFDTTRDESVVYNISDKLAEAYRDIGSYFAYYPKQPTTVIIYTPEQFETATSRSAGTLGLYDGKMRLRLTDLTQADSRLKKLIYHEYAHAVVSGLYPKNIPVWLHEGIAGWAADPDHKLSAGEKALLKNLISSGRLKKFYELNGYFSGSAPQQDLAAAYLESELFVRYFVRRYNCYYLKSLLSELASGNTFEQSVYNVLKIDLNRINSDFIEYLNECCRLP